MVNLRDAAADLQSQIMDDRAALRVPHVKVNQVGRFLLTFQSCTERAEFSFDGAL